MTPRVVAIRLEDSSPLYQALRRYAFERGIMKLSQAAIELLSRDLLPPAEEQETPSKLTEEEIVNLSGRAARSEGGPESHWKAD